MNSADAQEQIHSLNVVILAELQGKPECEGFYRRAIDAALPGIVKASITILPKDPSVLIRHLGMIMGADLVIANINDLDTYQSLLLGARMNQMSRNVILVSSEPVSQNVDPFGLSYPNILFVPACANKGDKGVPPSQAEKQRDEGKLTEWIKAERGSVERDRPSFYYPWKDYADRTGSTTRPLTVNDASSAAYKDFFPKDMLYQVAGIKEGPNIRFGFHFGDMGTQKECEVWVNPENTNMEMDNLHGIGISSRIRKNGALMRTDANTVSNDAVYRKLRAKMGRRWDVAPGSAIVTDLDKLSLMYRENGVRRIIHVASVSPRIEGQGVRIIDDIGLCMTNLLDKMVGLNKPWLRFLRATPLKHRFFFGPYKNVLVPLMGTGNGDGNPNKVSEALLARLVIYVRPALAKPEIPLLNHAVGDQTPSLPGGGLFVRFVAFKPKDAAAWQATLERFLKEGWIERLKDPKLANGASERPARTVGAAGAPGKSTQGGEA